MKARETLEALVPLPEAQRLLGISRPTLFRLLRRGDLAVIRIGGRTLIAPEDIRAFVDSKRERRSPGRSP